MDVRLAATRDFCTCPDSCHACCHGAIPGRGGQIGTWQTLARPGPRAVPRARHILDPPGTSRLIAGVIETSDPVPIFQLMFMDMGNMGQHIHQ